jgi:hypothetical protein
VLVDYSFMRSNVRPFLLICNGREQEAYLPTATDIYTDREGRVVRNNPGKQDFADLDPIRTVSPVERPEFLLSFPEGEGTTGG